MGQEYYDRLGVRPGASTEDIVTAYRERLKEVHPDVSDASDAKEQTRRLIEAKEVLTDETERARYDRLGHDRYVDLERGNSHRSTTDATTRRSDDTRADSPGRNGSGGADDSRGSGTGSVGGAGTDGSRGTDDSRDSGAGSVGSAGTDGSGGADDSRDSGVGSVGGGGTDGPGADSGSGRGDRSDGSRSYAVGGGDSGIDWDEWEDADWEEISEAVWEEVTGDQGFGGTDADSTGSAAAEAGGFGAASGATAGTTSTSTGNTTGVSGTGERAESGSGAASAGAAATGGDGSARTVSWYDGGDPSGSSRDSWSAGGANLAGEPWGNWTPGGSGDRYERETFPPHRILSPLQTGALLAVAFLTYPLFAFGTVFPMFGGATRLLLAIVLVFMIAVLIVLPQLGVAVFGMWAVLSPVLLAHLGVSLVAVESLAIIGTVLGALVLSVLSWLLTRPPAL